MENKANHTVTVIKKPYSTPKITNYGDVREITLSAGNHHNHHNHHKHCGCHHHRPCPHDCFS